MEAFGKTWDKHWLKPIVLKECKNIEEGLYLHRLKLKTKPINHAEYKNLVKTNKFTMESVAPYKIEVYYEN